MQFQLRSGTDAGRHILYDPAAVMHRIERAAYSKALTKRLGPIVLTRFGVLSGRDQRYLLLRAFKAGLVDLEGAWKLVRAQGFPEETLHGTIADVGTPPAEIVAEMRTHFRPSWIRFNWFFKHPWALPLVDVIRPLAAHPEHGRDARDLLRYFTSLIEGRSTSSR